MIIDAHTHADEFDAWGWYDPPEKLLNLMIKAGIDRSVITSYSDEPGPANGLKNLEKYLKTYPDKLIGFVRVDPKYGDKAIDVFEHAVKNSKLIRGLKLHPISNIVKPFAPISIKLLKKAAKLKVPVFFHCGDRALAQPFQIGKAAERCPDTTIICHMGGYFHSEDSITMAKKK